MDSENQEKKPYAEQYKNKLDEAWTELKSVTSDTFGGLLLDRRRLFIVSIILFLGFLALLRGFLNSLF